MSLARVLVVSLPLLVLGACNGSSPVSPSTSAKSAASASGDGDSKVVARVEGQPITLGELDSWIKDQLFAEQLRGKDPSEVHEFRADRLDQMIRERVVDAEAKRRGVTSEALLATARGKVTVDDAAVRAFYDKNKNRLGGAKFEQVAARIRQHLEAQEQRSAELTFVDKLVQKANVEKDFEAPRVKVAAVGPSRGPKDAPVTIVEFSDFQCPFCARAAPTVDQVLARYPKQVRFVYRNFPLESIHHRARAAAEAAACVAAQGHFWAYHDLLFAHQSKLDTKDLAAYAQQVGADPDAFGRCFAEGRFRAEVDKDIAAGRAAGVSGTPTFFINGLRLGGAQPLEEFVRVIDEELKHPHPTS